MNLNTIIEEEKKKRLWCFVAYEKSDVVDDFLPVHSRVFDDFNEMKEYSASHSANRPCTKEGKPEYYSTYFDTSLSDTIVTTTAMQRVTKAERINFLRSEIEKLGVEIRPTLSRGEEMSDDEVWNQALTSIITRYKEELLELEKGI